MNRETQKAIFDSCLPKWRDAPDKSGERRVTCPLHDDSDPSLRLNESKLTWFCDPCAMGGGAYDLAVNILGKAGAKELLEEINPSRRHEVAVLGAVPEPVVAALRQARRIISSRVLRDVGAKLVRARFFRSKTSDWSGWLEYIGFPTATAETWKLWALGREHQVKWKGNAGKHDLLFSPDLVDFSDTRIERLWDVEGESDWLAAIEAGLAYVLTPTGGATSTRGHDRQRNRLAELPVQEVCVVADNDDAGRRGGEKRAEWWRRCGVPVRVVELPDELGPKGDLRDYLNGRSGQKGSAATEPTGNAAALEALADAAPLLKPGSESIDWNSANSANLANQWEPPVAFDAEVYGPQVPVEAFPQEIADYIEEIAEVHQVARELVAGTALGALAASATGRAEVAIGNTHTEILALFMLPTAPPGERKAQAMRPMVAPIEEQERKLTRELQPALAANAQERAIGEKKLRRLQEQAAKAADPEACRRLMEEAVQTELALANRLYSPRLMLDDATPQAVSRALAEQGGHISFISEEAGTLVGIMGGRYARDSGADIDVYLKGYDGGQIRVDRIGRESIIVERPALTILTTPQPSILDLIASMPEFRGRGLVGRICFILAESLVGKRFYQDRSVSEHRRDAYWRVLHSILNLPAEKSAPLRRLTIQDAALGVWRVYHDECERAQGEGGRLSQIRDWASKHSGRAARIAGLFHLARHAGSQAFQISISAEDVTAAWAVADWLQEHALVAFARMGADPTTRQAKHYLAWIRRHRRERFTLKDLHDHHRNVDKVDEFLPSLAILEGRGFIRSEEPPPRTGRGRKPSPAFVVNPMTHSPNSPNSQNPSIQVAGEQRDHVSEEACG